MEVWVQILRKLGTNIVTVGEWGGGWGGKGEGQCKERLDLQGSDASLNTSETGLHW